MAEQSNTPVNGPMNGADDATALARRRRPAVVALALAGLFGLLAGAHHLLIAGAAGDGRFAGFAGGSCSVCHGAEQPGGSQRPAR